MDKIFVDFFRLSHILPHRKNLWIDEQLKVGLLPFKKLFYLLQWKLLKTDEFFLFHLKGYWTVQNGIARQKGHLLKICRCSARLTREITPLGRDIFILFRNICNDITFNRALTLKKVIVSATFWKRDFEIYCNFSAVPRKS